MQSHNIINVDFYIILNSVSRLHHDKVCKRSHAVNNNTLGVMVSPSLWKTNHEVHINGLPFPCRNLNRLSKTARIKMFCLKLFSITTLGHIFKNVSNRSVKNHDTSWWNLDVWNIWNHGPLQ